MHEMVFQPGARFEGDDWSRDGDKISEPEKLAAIKRELEGHGPVLLEHKFLRGGRGPTIRVFDEYDALVAYLTEEARAGDKISVWGLWSFMRDAQPLADGKCPDRDGAVPNRGAY